MISSSSSSSPILNLTIRSTQHQTLTTQISSKQISISQTQTKAKKMKSPILPISLPPSSSSSQTTTSTAMLLNGDLDDLQQSHVLLIPTSSSSSSSLSSYEDEKVIEKKPFFSRAFSYTRFTNLTKNQKRRRRVPSDAHLSSHTLQKSLSRDVGYITAETNFITRLGSKLLRCLGLGYGFITRFLALGCYSILIMPGFLQVAYYYYTSGQIRRNIVYGDQPRNRLDLYLPVNSDGPKPVIALITGGAWVLGYKAWGALLGQHLSERDFIVACIDYRNFPQATISEMVKDASQGISFLCKNIAEYGGDPNRIYLMGQSAGAHIAACVLVEQAIKESVEVESSSWSVSQIKAYIGLSGGYNLCNLVDHFHGRGLYRSMFLSMMEGEQSLERFSPEVRVLDPSNKNAVSLLPPIVLLHGVADYSIPSDSSKIFADALRRVGAQAELILYEGKTHTDLFVQDPFRGGESELINDIVSFIYAGDPVALAKVVVAPPARRLVPEFMLKLAGKVSPF